MKIPSLLCVPLACAITGLPTQAQESDSVPPVAVVEPTFLEALKGGETWVNLRYRYEHVDIDGAANNANANTLRTVLGYSTAEYKGFSGLLEFFNVSSIGPELYNSTQNGVMDRPVVADPTGSRVNRAQLKYAANDKNDLIGGRQKISLGNQRFVGPVNWRQNQQTFDSFSYKGTDLGGFDLFYGYIDNVNTVLQTTLGMSSHLANASYNLGETGTLGLYAYALDYDNATASALSTNTFGAQFTGAPTLNDNWMLDYRAELARQVDAGNNPNNVSADYMHLALGGDYRGTRLGLGYEVLGGTGTLGESFQTPLATLHKFNGWADRFLVTPADGLKDLYVSLGHVFQKQTALSAIYHDFQADNGGASYGTEIDLAATYKFNSELSFGVKYAYYGADTYLVDTTKAWLWVGYNF